MDILYFKISVRKTHKKHFNSFPDHIPDIQILAKYEPKLSY